MKKQTTISAFALVLAAALGACGGEAQQEGVSGWFEIPVPENKPEENKDSIAAGKKIYDFRCSPCHGVKGDAKGSVAKYLDPRPRDFTMAEYRFRTTLRNELPLDEDLFRTITRGVPGTAMPSWKVLPEDDRWNLVYYIKTFSSEFTDFSPYREPGDEGPIVAEIPEAPEKSDDLLALGAKTYAGACAQCHGQAGRGNGTGKDARLKKGNGDRIWARDLTKPWKYKNGVRVEDIFRTLTTGIRGTPMPSNLGSFHKEDPKEDEKIRWAVAYHVASLHQKFDPNKRTLDVKKVEGDLPSTVDDPAWENADELAIFLTGQVTFRPRWQIPTVDFVRVKALYNDKEIAFRITYDDRTPDRMQFVATPPEIGAETAGKIKEIVDGNGPDWVEQLKALVGDWTPPAKESLPAFREELVSIFAKGEAREAIPRLLRLFAEQPREAWSQEDTIPDYYRNATKASRIRKRDRMKKDTYPELFINVTSNAKRKILESTFRDALALEFPVKKQEGPAKPYFLYGNQGNPVHILKYESDRETNPVREYNATGFKKKPKDQEKGDQQTTGSGTFEDGAWTVIMRRPLQGDKKDVSFVPGEPMPFVVMAWDGGNGESGYQHSVSSWYTIRLDVPTPGSTWLYSAIAILLGLLFELFLLYKATRKG